jgi:FtsH-binding integral membrane protein
VASQVEIPAYPSQRLAGRKYDRPFFLAMTLLLAMVAAIGFAPTYYLVGGPAAPLPSRIVHMHAAIFTTWILLLITQTGLVSAHRVQWHRKLGVAGFVLAIAMVISVVLTGADLAARAKGKPGAEAILGLLSITFADACSFAVLAAFAYRLRRDSAAHKRLIIIATACITRAAFNRWHVPILFHQFYAAYAATYIFLLLLAAYGLWSSRRIHRATILGSTFLIFMGQMTRFVGPTASWHEFARWIQSWGV